MEKYTFDKGSPELLQSSAYRTERNEDFAYPGYSVLFCCSLACFKYIPGDPAMSSKIL